MNDRSLCQDVYTLTGEIFARETFARSNIREIFWMKFHEWEKYKILRDKLSQMKEFFEMI